ncbi:MAG: ATP-dependent Clp protease adaptor ClpS [Bacteroidota bacterium]
MSKYSHKEQEVAIDLLEEEVETGNHLVVFNDDFNTFDFVIESLIKICKHDPIQAEQCTHIIHYNGKCSVKDGSYTKLRPMCEALLDRGLSATID